MGAPPLKPPVCLIMAGGSGTRFWPLSQKNFPKQFLKLVGNESLLRATYQRSRLLSPADHIAVCGLEAHKTLLQSELPELSHQILEPQARNTAACVLLSALQLREQGFSPDTVMAVFPADHHVGTTEEWLQVMTVAVQFAASHDALVTLGITPSEPHTGYGYIQKAAPTDATGVFNVKQFVEKPDRARAEGFLATQNYFWNSGIFVWTLQAIIKAFESLQPQMLQALVDGIRTNTVSSIYGKLPSLPVDKAILEKADNVFVVPAPIDWSDLGSWNAVYEKRATKSADNVTITGNSLFEDCSGCLVQVPAATKVALIGLTDVVVVEHEGRLLITRRDQDQKVKKAAETFES